MFQKPFILLGLQLILVQAAVAVDVAESCKGAKPVIVDQGNGISITTQIMDDLFNGIAKISTKPVVRNQEVWKTPGMFFNSTEKENDGWAIRGIKHLGSDVNGDGLRDATSLAQNTDQHLAIPVRQPELVIVLTNPKIGVIELTIRPDRDDDQSALSVIRSAGAIKTVCYAEKSDIWGTREFALQMAPSGRLIYIGYHGPHPMPEIMPVANIGIGNPTRANSMAVAAIAPLKLW